MPKIHRLADRHADTEKVTVNLSHVDLGRIDLLVQEGFYSNRADFIRAAIRAQIGAEARAVDQTITRRQLELGLVDITRETLEALRASRERLDLKVLGLLRIADDVTPELARETIASVSVLGTLQAPAAVKAALKDRMT